MLCDCHHRLADTHNTNSPQSEEFRRQLRLVTYHRVMQIGKILTPEDKKYLLAHNLPLEYENFSSIKSS